MLLLLIILTLNPPSDNKKIKILHLGSISNSKKRSIEVLFNVLRDLVLDKKINPNEFELTLLGNLTKEESNIIKSLNISSIVTLHAPLPKKEALKFASTFDYFLFFGVPGQKSYISSKLFDYIKLKKPIIGICRGNEAELIIINNSLGNVYGFSYKDINRAFLDVIDKKIFFDPCDSKILNFSREVQTKKLLDYIYQCG